MDRFKEIFLRLLKGPLSNLFGLEAESVTSFYMEDVPVQDPFRARAKYLGLRIANLLIDETGELNRGMLEEINLLLDQGSFVLGPGRVGDVLLFSHIHKCLKELAANKNIWMAIRKFSMPLCHKKAEEVIRETLCPESMRILKDGHVRKAVLAAWLTLLRQATGSCFATAPAILVQKYEPLQFFKDLYDLLSIGQLKRVMGGKEYSVPLNFSSGMGDLQKVVSFPFFGLAIALESAGVKIAPDRIRELGPLSVEKLLRTLLLEDASITEEDIRDEEHLARLQMTPLLAREGAVYYQRPSERAQKVADWKKRFEKACISFKTITECALLRSWEYSIASLSDVKTEFARWNLYIGLGLHPDQQNGIGSFLYNQINEELQKCQEEIEQLAKEYEYEIGAIQALEVMIQGSTSEMRTHQLKAEWMSHNGSANAIVETRNRSLAKADGLTTLFAWLIERYDEKLQEYFQELFDPVLTIEEKEQICDDSPAGFRLVYKHARADASQWTSIHTKEEYIDSLRDFFSRIENELGSPANIEKEWITELTTSLIQFIRSDLFFEWAMVRSKEKGRLSPWHYISGGTLQTLLMVYRNRDRPFTEVGVVPHSVETLLQFLSKFDSPGPLLIHSPTHAFLFYPELMRQQMSLKRSRHQKWTEAMQEHLVHTLSERLPENERALFIHRLRQQRAESNVQFRANLLDALSAHIKQKEVLVDSFLYENALLFDQKEAEGALSQIVKKQVRLEGAFFGPFDLYNLAKMAVMQDSNRAIFNENWDQKIAEEMRRQGLLQEAILFGDTNWSDWFFGFVQNPTTGKLELWRLNQTATQGFPMNEWQEFLSPNNSSSWIVLSKQSEYLDGIFS